ncbi:P-type DNA transfer ATPase VirB11 [Pseudomonas syringae pv. pisi]|nr:P-type DNA transfer ATPase VirB11 [Pseudomonas syringae pv. pisi]
MTQEPDHSQDAEEQGLTEDTLVLDFLDQAGVTERLNRPGTQDVAINRPFEIWVDGPDGWVREDAPWLTYSLCWRLANALCALNYRVLAPHTPIHTVELPGGERGQIVMAPACEKGTLSMTFRKPSLERFTLDDYIREGRYDRTRAVSSSVLELKDWQHEMKRCHADCDWRGFYDIAIAHRQNIAIFGGPGSGKTTHGLSLLDRFPPHRRMLTIAEIDELKLPLHPNHVTLLYGHVVTPKQLIASAMRMKPDHVVLAELTGDEVWHLMEVSNTGKGGWVTTAHANEGEGASRVADLVKQSEIGRGLDIEYIERKVRMTFDVEIYMENHEIVQVYYEPEHKLALLNGQRQRR